MLQSDSYEKFLGRIFSSPDLMKITAFNTEIENFVAARLGILPANGIKPDHRKGKHPPRRTAPPTAVAHRCLPPKPKIDSVFEVVSDGTNNMVTRKRTVDELDDFLALQEMLKPRPPGSSVGSPTPQNHREKAAESPIMTGFLTMKEMTMPTSFTRQSPKQHRSGSPTEAGRSIFDSAHSIAHISDIKAKSTATLPEEAYHPKEAHTKGSHHHHRRGKEAKHLRPPPAEGILLKAVKMRYVTGSLNAVNSIAFSSAMEDTFVCSGGLLHTPLRSISSSQREPVAMIQDNDVVVNHVAVSEDVSLMATSGDDARLCLYDIMTLHRVAVCTHPGAVTCSSFSPNNAYVVSGCVDTKCRLWSTKPSVTATEIATYCGLQDRVTAIAFQTMGGLVASGSSSGEVHIWSASTTERMHAIAERTLKSRIVGLSFNWNGEILLAADKDHVLFSEVRTGAPLKVLVAGSWVSPQQYRGLFENVSVPCFTCAAFAPKANYPNYFVVCKGDNTVMLYEFRLEKIETNKEKYNQRPGHARSVDLRVLDEIWSTKLIAPAVCATPGLGHKILLGDGNGNVVVMSLQPNNLFTPSQPPPRNGMRVHVVPSVNPVGVNAL